MNFPEIGTPLEWLEQWCREQCNGIWEHQHGISISTVDNPGWSVVVDLAGTSLAHVEMAPYVPERDETDWVFCRVEGQKFSAHGDPSKLAWIINYFRHWVETLEYF